jgi:glycosyltransferase involved in cell wall biosynthesis
MAAILFWTYRDWQKAAYELGAQLHRKERFDIVHHLTMVGFREPGFFWKLDVPFVWGPIGGIENTPWRFLPTMGVKGTIYFGLRNVINSLHRRFLCRPKHAFRKAHGSIIAATGGIRREIGRWYGEESSVICEIGPPLNITSDYSLRKQKEPLKLVWSGLHDPGKALPLLLNAGASLSKQIAWRLHILGIGPCTPKWKRLAQHLHIEGQCNWHGWLRRDDALSLMHRAHVFVITSLKDLTSTVLLEALSLGVPVHLFGSLWLFGCNHNGMRDKNSCGTA